jgi:uncharacterized membrane-anchored protein
MKSKITLGLIIAALCQVLILSGMYVVAAIPFWTGTEIHIRTIPVDPRSMFRGNYALLRYEISEMDADLLPDSKDLRNGEIVYVALKPGKDNYHDFSDVSLEKPDSGVFLRGRIQNRYYEDNASYFRIKFGIEAFFAPKDKALSLERKLREGGTAVVMVSSSGRARLKQVINGS